jgi:hemolysin activation/secretion protein
MMAKSSAILRGRVTQRRHPTKRDFDRAVFRIWRSVAKCNALRYAIALSAVALAAFPLAAQSQVVAPSQVTPKNLRPAAPSAPGPPQISAPEPLQAPAGAEKLSFIVGHVTIKGAFPELETETRIFIKAVQGHRVSVARIYELANAMEEAYARAGYVLVRVTVPEQKLDDHGPLKIVVVDGFIEKVQVDNVPERVRALVAARMASLIGRRHIKLDEIERRLLISGDVPGLRLKSTLARGKNLGGALLVLEGTHQLVTGTASVDNRMPASLGTWTYGTSVALNSAFGLGEQFYGSAQTGGDLRQSFDPASPFRVLGVGAVLPLGLDGWIVNPEYTYSRTVPEPVDGGVANIGTFTRFALRSSYPVIRTRTETLTLTGAYEYINQNVFLPMLDTDLNRDRYGVLRGGAAIDTALPWLDESIQASATFSKGTGGRDAADAVSSGIPLSRPGAGPSFDKANFDAHLIQPLSEGFRFDLFGHAQTSFGQPLLTPEQFFLDGPQAVSAYATGALPVDEGATLRGELSRSFSAPGPVVPLILSPYAFGVVGVGRLDDPTAAEVASVQAASFGAGVRTGLDLPGGYQGLTANFEVARQFSDLPTLAHGWRENVSISMRF